MLLGLTACALGACGFTPGTLPGPMAIEDAQASEVDAQQVAADAAVDAEVDAITPPPPPTWVVIDTLTVPVDGNGVMSAVTLGNGVGYRLRAEGTFVIQSPQGTPADAEWWDYNNTPVDGVAGVDVGLAVNDSTVNDTRTPKWGAYSSSHVYEVAWVGNGQKLTAALHDGNFTNNTGSLTLKVLALQ